LLASCFSVVLDVARYAIEQTRNKLLNNQIKSVQDLMTDLGSTRTEAVLGCKTNDFAENSKGFQLKTIRFSDFFCAL